MGWVSIEPLGAVSVRADGELIFFAMVTLQEDGSYLQNTVTPNDIDDATLIEPIMRLPSVIAKEWVVQVDGSAVDSICIAQSIDEIKSS